MKIGSIYKIIKEDREIVGIVIKQEEEMDGMDVFKMIASTGTIMNVAIKKEDKVTSTKLKTEVRDALKNAYKQYKDKKELEEEIKKMERALREKKQELDEGLKKIKEVSDEFTIRDLANNFYNIKSYSTNPANPRFDFYLKKEVEKYARPEDYSFLYREYDGNIFIDNNEACIKRYGLKVPKPQIEHLKKQLKHTKLENVSDDCSIGDKSTLYVSKVFEFAIKKGVKRSEIMQECEFIDKWIKSQEEMIGV